MSKVYPPDPDQADYVPIDEQSMNSIGRIIRSFAEIEDILTCFILSMARVQEAEGMLLLGRSAFRMKLDIGKKLALMHGQGAPAVFDSFFGGGFGSLLQCRNTLAHGVYLGRSSLGTYCFLTSDLMTPDETTAGSRVHSYKPEALRDLADQLELIIPKMEEQLNVAPLRQTRAGAMLHPDKRARHRTDSEQASTQKPKNR